MKTLFAILFFLLFVPCGTKSEGVQVQFVEELQGDFSFIGQWNYADNVFRNEFGQLICDGLCDEELYRMHDVNGRIPDDSLDKYYQLLDTTHHHFTISCEAYVPEWGGTDFAYAYRAGDTVKCYTGFNIATHSSLQLSIVNGRCIPCVELNSISNSGGLQYFEADGGSIKIDESMIRKDTLKAEFDFYFKDPAYPEGRMWWKGRIYTKIGNDGEVIKN